MQAELRTARPWAPGFRVRIVDGNHLPASDKRLAPLRYFPGAALPGHSLVIYDPDLDQVVDIVPCEDAHQQEKNLMPAILEKAEAGALWLADRQFCTRSILATLHARQAFFLFRESSAHPQPTALGALRPVGRVETGMVYEQAVAIPLAGEQRLRLRRIELHLDEPTEDGETSIRLLTNVLPRKRLHATRMAQLYRGRWRIEGLFSAPRGHAAQRGAHARLPARGPAGVWHAGVWHGGRGLQRAGGVASRGRDASRGGRRGPRDLAVLRGQ